MTSGRPHSPTERRTGSSISGEIESGRERLVNYAAPPAHGGNVKSASGLSNRSVGVSIEDGAWHKKRSVP